MLRQMLPAQFGLAQAPTLLAQQQLPPPDRVQPGCAPPRRPTYAHTDRTAGSRLLCFWWPSPRWQQAKSGSKGHTQCAAARRVLATHSCSTWRRVRLPAFAGPYDFVRFYLPAATLDRLADDQGLPRVRGLRTTPPQVRDQVMQGLALSLLPVLEAPHAGANRFLDSVALAFHAHVMRRYGGTPLSKRYSGARLAPWQLRRVLAFVDANLDADPSIADLAAECRLSPSHFARAFSASTGTSPHKWLVNRRIEQAKALLLGGGDELSQIALACGFVDQSCQSALNSFQVTAPKSFHLVSLSAQLPSSGSGQTPTADAPTFPSVALRRAALKDAARLEERWPCGHP